MSERAYILRCDDVLIPQMLDYTEANFHKQPYRNRQLSVFIVAPDGEYATHCGIWHTPDTDIC